MDYSGENKLMLRTMRDGNDDSNTVHPGTYVMFPQTPIKRDSSHCSWSLESEDLKRLRLSEGDATTLRPKPSSRGPLPFSSGGPVYAFRYTTAQFAPIPIGEKDSASPDSQQPPTAESYHRRAAVERRSSSMHSTAVDEFYRCLGVVVQQRGISKLRLDDMKDLVQILHVALQGMTRTKKSTGNGPKWKVSTAMLDEFIKAIFHDWHSNRAMEPVDALDILPYDRKGYHIAVPRIAEPLRKENPLYVMYVNPREGEMVYSEEYTQQGCRMKIRRDWSRAAGDDYVRGFHTRAIKATISDCERYNSERAVQYGRMYLDEKAMRLTGSKADLSNDLRRTEYTFARYDNILDRLPSLEPIWDKEIVNIVPNLFHRAASKI